MLTIKLQQDEPFLIEHQGVEVWITMRKDGGGVRAYIAGPKEVRISRPHKHDTDGDKLASFERLFGRRN